MYVRVCACACVWVWVWVCLCWCGCVCEMLPRLAMTAALHKRYTFPKMLGMLAFVDSALIIHSDPQGADVWRLDIETAVY
jgi:hypothetical protein